MSWTAYLVRNMYVRIHLFPNEILFSVNMSGMTKHELKLKAGMVVILIRNINKFLGLCNDTWMVVKKIFK